MATAAALLPISVAILRDLQNSIEVALSKPRVLLSQH